MAHVICILGNRRGIVRAAFSGLHTNAVWGNNEIRPILFTHVKYSGRGLREWTFDFRGP